MCVRACVCVLCVGLTSLQKRDVVVLDASAHRARVHEVLE